MPSSRSSVSKLLRTWHFSSFVNPIHSHPAGLDVTFLVESFVYFHASCVRSVKALTRLRACAGSPVPSLVSYVISTKISWAGSKVVLYFRNNPNWVINHKEPDNAICKLWWSTGRLFRAATLALNTSCNEDKEVVILVDSSVQQNKKRRLLDLDLFFVSHYVNISACIKLCCISVIPSYILSILLMNFKSKLLILYKTKLNRHKIGCFSTKNVNKEKWSNIMLINTYPRFPPFLLYFRCKLGVTFARRRFRDVVSVEYM